MVLFPPEWIKEHPDFPKTIPKTTEIVPPTTLIQQANVVEKYLATNWTGICSQLPNISKRTLIITGTHDNNVPPANSLVIAGKIPGAWLVQIKDAGHAIPSQYPDKINRVLQTFLSVTITSPS